MSRVVIENPIINSPFAEPVRHFRFTEEGITNELVPARRISTYFVPVPRARRQNMRQQEIDFTEWTQDRVEENKLINEIRSRVATWRQGGYAGKSADSKRKTTRRKPPPPARSGFPPSTTTADSEDGALWKLVTLGTRPGLDAPLRLAHRASRWWRSSRTKIDAVGIFIFAQGVAKWKMLRLNFISFK